LIKTVYCRSACDFCHDFIDRGLLLQGSCCTKDSKWLSWSHYSESITIGTMNLLTVAEYLCHKRPQICSICRNHNPVLPSFITYHRCCNKSNRTGETSGAGTAYRSEARASPPVISGHLVVWSIVFCALFCRSLIVFLFFFPNVLSVLFRITSSDYPFGILKLFLEKRPKLSITQVVRTRSELLALEVVTTGS
jgi:hypothetical protein